MKNVSFLAICLACVATLGAADLSDLMVREPVNPDDVMLRRPAGRTRAELDARAKAAAAAAEAQAKAQAEAEAKARAEAEARAKEEAAKAQAEAEAKARAEAEAKAKEEAAKAQAETEAKAKEDAAKARAEAEAKAREEEAAKVAAEKAKVEAELQALREQVAREKEARKEIEGKAAMDRMAAERAAAQAVSDRVAAEKAAAQAAADRAAAEKATEAKAAAEKRISYLQNPDPDERPKPKKLEAPAEQQDVTETVPGPEKKSRKHKKAKGEKGASGRTGRDAVITSERTDYDRKEGVILFDRNVFVDDELYQMHADRLFVFLDGTNDLKRIVAIGNVSITNEQRTASCSRAVFTKAASKIVMYGDETSNAKLEDPSQRGGVAEGKKITFWLDAEQVSVEGSAVSLPGGMLKGRDPKKFLEGAK